MTVIRTTKILPTKFTAHLSYEGADRGSILQDLFRIAIELHGLTATALDTATANTGQASQPLS
jgi:hypothetical protein